MQPRALGVSCAIVLAAASVAAQTPRTIWDGVFSLEQAERGQTLYREQCAQCHGDALEGVEMAPALAGYAFYGNWEGETLDGLFERMRKTMPQNDPGALSREQNADILAYMLRVGGYPPGDASLDGQGGALRQVRILTFRPQ